jgi:hypothetical protein
MTTGIGLIFVIGDAGFLRKQLLQWCGYFGLVLLNYLYQLRIEYRTCSTYL